MQSSAVESMRNDHDKAITDFQKSPFNTCRINQYITYVVVAGCIIGEEESIIDGNLPERRRTEEIIISFAVVVGLRNNIQQQQDNIHNRA